MKINRFGTLDDGTAVNLYEMESPDGVRMVLTEYGARIVELATPDLRGDTGSVVLGYRSLEEYVRDPMFFGAVAGRVAGRIGGASFELDGVTYRFEPNDGPNLLHGGSPGFHEVLWAMDEQESADRKITLRYRSADGEAGFPGNLDAAVEYSLESPGELRITFRGTTDNATPFSPTNHAYFNLSGGQDKTIDGHLLQICSESFTPFDTTCAFTGEVRSVAGDPADFRRPRRLGDAIPDLNHSHGDNYLIGEPGTLRESTVAVHEGSGRRLTVLSEAQCLQFFGGQYIPEGLTGRYGKAIPPRGAFCLESQDFPDGANHPEIGNIILRPGEEYRRTTVWRFDVIGGS